MLNKLSRHNKLITCVLVSTFLVFLILTLIFSNADGKFRFFVLSLAIPTVVYVFMRFAYKVVLAHATYEITRIFIWFYLIGGTVMTLSDTVRFLTSFPDGLSYSFGASVMVVIASLGEAKRFGK